MSSIYDDLVDWYRLLDPLADHAEEAAALEAAARHVVPDATTLLELGSGAGNGAHFMKHSLRCTLTDISPAMLTLSRAVNPECEHLEGDMRSLRLDRSFDIVLAHDAIVYMTTRADLIAALETAFLHTRPGGVALLAPDCVGESFKELSQLHENDDGVRSLRCLDWMWDPEPSDETYRVDYSLLLRDGAVLRSCHETHIEGLFTTETWLGTLRQVGFDPGIVPRFLDDEEVDAGYAPHVFVAHRRS